MKQLICEKRQAGIRDWINNNWLSLRKKTPTNKQANIITLLFLTYVKERDGVRNTPAPDVDVTFFIIIFYFFKKTMQNKTEDSLIKPSAGLYGSG